jgi:hypothetical protein
MAHMQELREAFRRNMARDEDIFTSFDAGEQTSDITGAPAETEYFELLGRIANECVMPFDYQDLKTMTGFTGDLRTAGVRMDAGARHNAFIRLLREVEFMMDDLIEREAEKERRRGRCALRGELEAGEDACFFSPQGERAGLDDSFNMSAGYYRLDPDDFAPLAQGTGIYVSEDVNAPRRAPGLGAQA